MNMDNWNPFILSLVTFIPLAGALLLLLLPRRDRDIRVFALVVSLLTFVLSLHLPVHFHIGASVTTMTYFGTYPWESQDENTKLAIGGTLLFIGNARVVTNIILSGLLDRHPKLQMVSVESGVGWVPFILEALDYEMSENAPQQLDALSMLPSEYFKRNLFATFWFERNNLPTLVEAVGADRILFETDFPHPTCLYPKPLDTVAEKMSVLAPDVQRKILGENAAKLYRL